MDFLSLKAKCKNTIFLDKNNQIFTKKYTISKKPAFLVTTIICSESSRGK